MGTASELHGKTVTYKFGRNGTTYQGVVTGKTDRGRVVVSRKEGEGSAEHAVWPSVCRVVEPVADL